MGVYIKGMTLEQLKNMGIAGIQLNMERLVEVPEPHGRLIDADALFKIIKWHHDLYKGSENASDKARRDENLQVMCDITDAPTAIEAEGE